MITVQGHASNAPLLAVLTQVNEQADAAWKAWRSSVDIQHLTWSEIQILPLLSGPRLEFWLADDPAAGVLLGIVRRAWSEAQVRLGSARDVVRCLDQAGCGPVTLTGAVGTHLRNVQNTAIRPILELRMLISRRQLVQARCALEAEGWQLVGEVISGPWLDKRTHVVYSRNGARLCLYWRMLQVDIRRAAACEREFLAQHLSVEAIGSSFRILTAEHALLEALGAREETVDALAWQAEASLICRGGIDWRRWTLLAARYQPDVFERIPEMRALGIDVPELNRPNKLTGTAWTGWVTRVEDWWQTAGDWARRFSAAGD